MKRLVSAFAVATGALVVLAGSAVAATSAVGLVSGPSPFAGCHVGDGTGLHNFVNAEVEPQVTLTSKLIVGAWQQDRWSNGGSHGLVSGASSNGGKNWNEYPQPFSLCAQPFYDYPVAQYERASDPWVSAGPDGTIYSNAISFNRSNNQNGVFAATSTDGLHWSNLTALVEYTTNGGQFSTDKNSVTADPVTGGFAYSVWDTLVTATDNPDDNPHAVAYNGDAYFSKTVDGGAHWSSPTVIFPTSQHTQTIGNQIVVDPRNGTLYDFTSWIQTPNGTTNTEYYAAFVKSTDGGATWTSPQSIARQFTVGVTDPNTGARIRVGDGIPEAAIDPASGQLYVVWEESSAFKRGNAQAAEDDTVTLATSINGGDSWTFTSPVNTFKPNGPAFTPSVRVNSAGTVAVTYYDFRNLTAGNTATLPTDYWITYSLNNGGSFSGEKHIAGPFNMLGAPYARGYFVGDYQGLATSGAAFIPFFARVNDACNTAVLTAACTDNRNDIFVGYSGF